MRAASAIEARFPASLLRAAGLVPADVAKLVDAPDLGSGAERRGGSSPSIRTIILESILPTVRC